jgi:uncharacterized protein
MRQKFFFIIVILFVWDTSDAQTQKPYANRVRVGAPSQQGWITDFERIIDSNSRIVLTEMARDYQITTSNQICILVEPRPKDNFVTYARDVGDQWGLWKEGKENEVLIVFSKQERNVWIALSFSQKKKITDSVCNTIIHEKIYPKFREEKFAEGLISGMKEIIAILEKQ